MYPKTPVRPKNRGNFLDYIEAVQNRAMRFYLGTEKYTPNAAVIGVMGWEPAIAKQHACVAYH